MSVIKSLVGSVIGAAIAVAIYYGIKQATGQTFVWFPIVIGVLTGLVASMMTSSQASNAARYVAGAFAGLIAGAAIFGVDVVPALVAGETEFDQVDLQDRLTPIRKEQDKDPDTSDGVGAQPSGDPASDVGADRSEALPNDEDAADESAGDVGESAAGIDGTGDDTAEAGDSEQDEEMGSEDVTTRVDPNEAFKDRGVVPERLGGPDNSKVNQELFAERIKKQKLKTWYDLWMPYVFAGLGILIAYQLARGFGSAPTAESKA